MSDDPAGDDPRRFAPATLRNRDAILNVLRGWLPGRGTVLEIASGSGEHVCHFAAGLPELTFQPSDPDVDARASIDAWVVATGLANVSRALALDATAADWPIESAGAILCINMIHISPWASTQGLFAGAARLLAPGALLYLYGPYRQAGTMSESNRDFDASLRERNSRWGVRDLEAVAELAVREGFDAPEIVAMPANNLSLAFRRKR